MDDEAAGVPEETRHFNVNWETLQEDPEALDAVQYVIGFLCHGDPVRMRMANRLLKDRVIELHQTGEEDEPYFHFAPGPEWEKRTGYTVGEDIAFQEVEINLN